jgi:hypothetical protein
VGYKDVCWRDKDAQRTNNEPRAATADKIMAVARISAAGSIAGVLLPFVFCLS